MKNNKLVDFKKILISLILVMIILISGCNLSLNKSDENKNSVGIGFSSGSSSSQNNNGLVMKFNKNAPPSTMYEGSSYPFSYVFENYLPIEIKTVYVKTEGFDRTLITGLPETFEVQDIPAWTSTLGPGRVTNIFEGVKGDNFQGNYNFNPKFIYAYEAETYFLKSVCIPNKLNQCNLKVDNNLKEFGPVKVTIKDILNLNGKIRIDFVLNNNGNGVPVNEDTKFKNENYLVKISNLKVTLGNQNGICKPLGTKTFALLNGKGSFYCFFSNSNQDAYLSQVKVTFNYWYRQEKDLNIIIKSLNNNQ